MTPSAPRDMPALDLRAFGYAPGHYSVRCAECGVRHEADKRATSCEMCASQASKRVSAQAAPASRDMPATVEERDAAVLRAIEDTVGLWAPAKRAWAAIRAALAAAGWELRRVGE